MAKKRRGRPPGSGKAARAAESFGTAMGTVAAKLDGWLAQRNDIAQELRAVINRAQGMLSALSDGGMIGSGLKGRPGAPTRKRRKMSAKARKAISDAQKARWAKQKKAEK